MLTCIVTRTCL